MEEQRRLHHEVLAAVSDTKIAAAEAKGAAESFRSSLGKLESWVLNVDKRVHKIERWQTGIIGAGVVAGALIWEKAKKVLGL